jgi:GntR family transcriptional repressor for pyruvate dehydrogenase complex
MKERADDLLAQPADDLLAQIVAMAAQTRADVQGRIRLPTEREIAERLGVQRATVRERLTVLETLGFLRRVQGSGTYLALPTSQFLQFYFETALKLGFVSFDHVQVALETIGAEMAATAAIEAETADFDVLARAIDGIAVSRTVDDSVERQFEFHAVLASACANPVITLLLDGLASVIRAAIARRVRVMAVVSGAFARNTDAYAAVLQALREREPELARTAMRECYAVWRRESAKVAILTSFDAENP